MVRAKMRGKLRGDGSHGLPQEQGSDQDKTTLNVNFRLMEVQTIKKDSTTQGDVPTNHEIVVKWLYVFKAQKWIREQE